MKYLKTYESLREEYPGMFEPVKPEDMPKSVPGFEDGTIDPEDDDPYYIDENGKIFFHDNRGTSEKERYEKEFIKIVKERNFKETKDSIIINLRGLGQDFCMSIYNYTKYLRKFLTNELKGKYIIDGFKYIIKDENIEGVIENVYPYYTDDLDCTVFFTMKLQNMKGGDGYACTDTIVIDKFKSSTLWKDSNKFNL